jgi:methylmalonyl-CoA mutase cobalamin-binding subunit
MQKLGELWREGSLKVVHEHLASAAVRTFLGNLRGNFEVSETAPTIVVTTPAGQQHELGALIAAATASSEGWRVNYLGPNLPAEEIAKAAQESGAKAVALSLIHPADDPRADEELRRLRRCLSEDTAILIGGRAAESYGATIDAIGAERLQDMLSFRAKLERIRTG